MIIELIWATASTPPPDNTSTQILIAALGAGGFGAIIAAIVTGLFSKKKLGSEATEIITRAASGVVTSIEAELARAQKARTDDRTNFDKELEALKGAHAREIEEVRRFLQAHVAWDFMMSAKLEEHGITGMPKPPPLLPPGIGSLEI